LVAGGAEGWVRETGVGVMGGWATGIDFGARAEVVGVTWEREGARLGSERAFGATLAPLTLMVNPAFRAGLGRWSTPSSQRVRRTG